MGRRGENVSAFVARVAEVARELSSILTGMDPNTPVLVVASARARAEPDAVDGAAIWADMAVDNAIREADFGLDPGLADLDLTFLAVPRRVIVAFEGAAAPVLWAVRDGQPRTVGVDTVVLVHPEPGPMADARGAGPAVVVHEVLPHERDSSADLTADSAEDGPVGRIVGAQPIPLLDGAPLAEVLWGVARLVVDRNIGVGTPAPDDGYCAADALDDLREQDVGVGTVQRGEVRPQQLRTAAGGPLRRIPAAPDDDHPLAPMEKALEDFGRGQYPGRLPDGPPAVSALLVVDYGHPQHNHVFPIMNPDGRPGAPVVVSYRQLGGRYLSPAPGWRWCGRPIGASGRRGWWCTTSDGQPIPGVDITDALLNEGSPRRAVLRPSRGPSATAALDRRNHRSRPGATPWRRRHHPLRRPGHPHRPRRAVGVAAGAAAANAADRHGLVDHALGELIGEYWDSDRPLRELLQSAQDALRDAAWRLGAQGLSFVVNRTPGRPMWALHSPARHESLRRRRSGPGCRRTATGHALGRAEYQRRQRGAAAKRNGQRGAVAFRHARAAAHAERAGAAIRPAGRGRRPVDSRTGRRAGARGPCPAISFFDNSCCRRQTAAHNHGVDPVFLRAARGLPRERRP